MQETLHRCGWPMLCDTAHGLLAVHRVSVVFCADETRGLVRVGSRPHPDARDHGPRGGVGARGVWCGAVVACQLVCTNRRRRNVLWCVRVEQLPLRSQVPPLLALGPRILSRSIYPTMSGRGDSYSRTISQTFGTESPARSR